MLAKYIIARENSIKTKQKKNMQFLGMIILILIDVRNFKFKKYN